MLRLFSRLWRPSVPGAQYILPPGNAFASRSFNSGCLLRTDANQPGHGDKIDLDLWKSVMRSKVEADESLGDVREQVNDGDPTHSPEGCVLSATRSLVSMWRQAGKKVPEQMTDEHVQTVADLPTKSSKKKYLKYLAIREDLKKKEKEKREKRRSEREHSLAERLDADQNQPAKNTFLMQYRDRWLDQLLGWRGAQAMRFGQPLVLDMSYEANMSPQELRNSASQIVDVESFNRRALDPFHLHLCNLQPDGGYRQQLVKRYGAEPWDRLLITETPQHFMDVFPQEQLVYLTADSPNVLQTFDPSKVYVVGAIVDRSIQPGLSFANAKRLQLATARLPLDQYLRWEIGAKNLTLDQMICILLSIKDTGSWEKALSFVPKRKHDGFYQERQSDRVGAAGRYRGDRKPWRDQGDREPWRDQGERKPWREQGDREPWREQGDREPWRDQGDRKPWRDQGDRKPWRDQGDREPWRAQGDRKPWRDQGDRKPWRDQGDREPWRAQGERDPRRFQGDGRRSAREDLGSKSFGSRESGGAGRGSPDFGVPSKGVRLAGDSEVKPPVTRIRLSQKSLLEKSRRTDKMRTPWHEPE